VVVLVKGSIRNSTDVHVPTLWTLAMIGVMQSFQRFLDTFCDASVMNRTCGGSLVLPTNWSLCTIYRKNPSLGIFCRSSGGQAGELAGTSRNACLAYTYAVFDTLRMNSSRLAVFLP